MSRRCFLDIVKKKGRDWKSRNEWKAAGSQNLESWSGMIKYPTTPACTVRTRGMTNILSLKERPANKRKSSGIEKENVSLRTF